MIDIILKSQNGLGFLGKSARTTTDGKPGIKKHAIIFDQQNIKDEALKYYLSLGFEIKPRYCYTAVLRYLKPGLPELSSL